MADETLTKADLDAAVKAATDKLQESITRLEGKNEELIGENRRLKRGAEIKPEDLEAAEKRADAAEAKAKELEGSVKTLTKERDTAVKNLETESAFTQKLLIQDGLKSALIAAGVKDEDHLDFAVAKFSQGASVKIDGETRVAMIGDKSLNDHIKEWAGSDAGKKFVAAPVNGGGGAGGGRDVKADATRMTREAYNGLDQNAKAEAGMKAAKGEVVITD